MSRKRMSRGVRISVIMIVALLLLAAAVVGGIIILGNHSSELPDVERTTKLDAPKNVSINDDWMLTFDAVDNSIEYYILIDGEKNLRTTGTSIDVSAYATAGLHTFRVRALHKLASFNSDYSAMVSKEKYITLDTPSDVILTSLLFSWGQVSGAKSYELLVIDDKGNKSEFYSTNTEYSLGDYVANNPSMLYFSVQVRASAKDRASGSGLTNKYIRSSEYSTALNYYRPTTIQQPRIERDGFGEVTYVGDERKISWVINSDTVNSDYVDYFEIWFDGDNIVNIENSQFNSLSKYTFDLGQYAITDTIGGHEIYISAVPKEGAGVTSQRSNIISYTVRSKLNKVDASKIQISKEGLSLAFQWEVVDSADRYSIEIQSRLSEKEDFTTFASKNDIKDFRFTMLFETIQTAIQSVRVRVKAIAPDNGYIDDAEWSEYSDIFDTVTVLNPVGNISVTYSEESTTLSWAGQNKNEMYKQYLGAYNIKVYSAEYDGTAYVKKKLVFECNTASSSEESVVISDLMRASKVGVISAGAYIATVTAMPNSKAGQFYRQSEPSSSGMFEYKIRLATPSDINVTRDYAEGSIDGKLTLSFVGTSNAIRYDVVVSNSDMTAITFSIAQPEGYTAGDRISDTEKLQLYLGGKTEPSDYRIAISAVAQEGQTFVLNSLAGVLDYKDILKHNAVELDSVEIVQTDGKNELKITWGAVSTVGTLIGYDYYLRGVDNQTNIEGSITSTEITLVADNIFPGRYKFGVRVKAVPNKYRDSDWTVSSEFDCVYNISGTADISFTYQRAENKADSRVLVSMAYFDKKVTGFAIQFGNSTPIMMTIDEEKSVVTYLANLVDQLPVYKTTKVTIWAGVANVSDGELVKQAGIAAMKGISTDFTNDFVVSDVALSVTAGESDTNRVLTLTLDVGADKFTKYIDWEVLFGGRVIYNERIKNGISQEMTRNLNTSLNKSSFDAGEYLVRAKVTSTTGDVSEYGTTTFVVRKHLPDITGITRDSVDNAYLQWDEVKGASRYSVSVTRNGVSLDVNLICSQRTVKVSGNTSKNIIRIETFDLFTQKGFGTYRFTITAHSGSAYIYDSTTTYEWVIDAVLATPSVTIKKDSRGVYAHIWTSGYVEKYVITTVGISSGGDYVVEGNNTNGTEAGYLDVRLPGLVDAGTFLIKVVAVPNNEIEGAKNSRPREIQYNNVITADKPNGVSATQTTDGFEIAWDNKQYTIWSLDSQKTVSSLKQSLNVSVTVSTLNGEFYKDSNGNAIAFDVGNGGRFSFVSANSQHAGLLDFLNTKNESTYLIHFVAKGIDGKIEDSDSIYARLAYQVALGQPALAISGGNKLIEGESITLSITNLEYDVIDVEIKQGSNVITTLYAQTTQKSGETYTYELNGSVLSNCNVGQYSVSVRATQNGIYKASEYSNSVDFYYAKYVGEVSGIIVDLDKTANKLTISFDKLSVNCNYTVIMKYGSTDYDFTPTGDENSKAKYEYDYSANSTLQTVFNNNDFELEFAITANPVDTNIYVAQTTSYTYSQGTVAAPTNFKFEKLDNQQVKITWQGDSRYSESSYDIKYGLEIVVTNNSNTGQTITKADHMGSSYTVVMDDVDLDSVVCYFVITINSITVTEKGGDAVVASKSGLNTTASWVNTVDTTEATVDIDYSSDSQEYIATISHTSNNGAVFGGQTYTLFIGPLVIKSNITAVENATTTSIKIEDAVKTMLESMASQNQNADYTLIIGDAVMDVSATRYVGYKGKTITGTLKLPIVISDAPVVEVDATSGIATLSEVQNATKYKFVIKSSDNTYSKEEIISSISGKSMYNFAGIWENWPVGNYTIEFSVESDVENKIYAKDSAKTVKTVVKQSTLKSVTDIECTTQPNGKGDFKTTITWKYSKESGTSDISVNNFKVSLISAKTGAEYGLTGISGIEVKAEAIDSSTIKYSISLPGRDLTQSGYPVVNNGVDPTRSYPAGEYLISVSVVANKDDSGFYQDSGVAYAKKNYINKFGVVKISESVNAFNVAPEGYFKMNNGEMTMNAEQKEWLKAYEELYGFNRKYLVVSSDGIYYNIATHYDVYVNGEYVGMVGKGDNTVIDFDKLQLDDNKLNLGNVWKAGENTINIIPTTSSENYKYYFYCDTQSGVAHSIDSAEAKAALFTSYTVAMYKKFTTPSESRLNIEYDDEAGHNISKVDVSFANSVEGDTYSVTLHYYDYYNNGEATSKLLGSNIGVTFENSQNIGLELFELFKRMGPHEMYFEIKQVGSSADNQEYYIDSDAVKTEWFTNTISVQEFGEQQTTQGRNVSVVTEINSLNQNIELSYATNGHLKWTLPVNTYDSQVKYTVTLADNNQKYAFDFWVILNLGFKDDGKIDYRLSNTNAGGAFYLATSEGCLYFDMTRYFYNDAAILGDSVRPAAAYYLVGEYYYRIKAEGLDKDGKQAANRIYDPVNMFPLNTFGVNKYIFKDVEYPTAPYEVVVDANGMLSWKYAANDIYSNVEPEFGIKIITKKANGEENEPIIMTGITKTTQYDISEFLYAGGSERNIVYVYRVRPNEYFLDSKSILANFDENYSNISLMPSITADWRGAGTIDYKVSEDINRLRSVARDLKDNGAGAQFVINLLRVDYNDISKLASDATFDSIIADNKIAYTKTSIEAEELNLDALLNAETATESSYSLNLLDYFDSQSTEEKYKWLTDDGLLVAGGYYVKVELRPINHEFYEASKAEIVKTVKEMWRILSEDDATLTGEYLTTKAKTDEKGIPVNQNDRKWAEADQKNAILNFVVYSLVDENGVRHLPKQVAVKVKLWNGVEYNLSNIYEITYSLPALSGLVGSVTQIVSESGDVVVTRYNDSQSLYSVSINIHRLFDYSEGFAASVAGVYHLEWVIKDDDVGGESDSRHADGSTWYSYSRDICNYAAIQTPILDYRMDTVKSSGWAYNYVINWALTPNKYTYQVNEDIDYNLNIFAFESSTDSGFACDTQYNKLSEANKKVFLQNETGSSVTTSYGFKLEKFTINLGKNYEYNGRRCYVNEDTNIGMDLTPNKYYKFFLYLSPKVQSSSDPNEYYYLSSETSAPCVYLYKAISPTFTSITTTAKETGKYATESQTDLESADIYLITADQYYNGYNNAFELYVYDTQASDAGDNASWTDNQEEAGTYLAHYIIGTKSNDANYNVKQNLYIRESDGNYGTRVVGTLKNIKNGDTVYTSINLDKLTLGDLFGEKSDTPITYLCKVKSWIDNDEVNYSSGKTPLNIYSEDWIREYITTDEDEVSKYVDALTVREVPLADFNSLNPSRYVQLQHTLKFAQPSISRIEIINDGAVGVTSGSCYGVYDSNNHEAVTSGYISANSEGDYYYKIYLDNVYNSDPVVRADKYIKLRVSLYNFNEDGTWNTDSADSREAILNVNYDIDKQQAYVIVGANSVESGVSEMFGWMKNMLPNKLQFTATAVMGNSNQNDSTDTNVGGDNKSNKFLFPGAYNQTYYTIYRQFVDSDQSEWVALTVKKQYSAPKISLRYDNTSSLNLIDGQNTQTRDGYETNISNSGEYAGMALNPYLYVSKEDSNYSVNEYARLSNDSNTNYLLELSYGGTKVTHTFSTKDINATMTEFALAVRGQTNWGYDYQNYADKYPYEVACLYQKLYQLINKGVANGDYHGGLVTMSLCVVAPRDGATAGYWVTSDYGAETTLAFSVRLETVQTSFDASKAQIEDSDGQRNLANMYAQNGYYYYYQGQIPFEYKAISKDVNYRVYLTRTNPDGTQLVYSYDTLESLSNQVNGQDAAVWTPQNKTFGATNTGNLASILAQDLFGSDYTDAGKNQWLLGGEWYINIIAYADSIMNDNYITRGFDSYARTYFPVLQLVNDVSSVTVKMNVNATTGEVADFDSNFESIISYSSSVNKNGNLSVSSAEFKFTNSSSSTWSTDTVDFSNLTDNFPTRYKKLLRYFFNQNYINNNSVIGGKYSYKFRFVVAPYSLNSEYLLDSDSTSEFVFEYYKQLNENDIKVEAMQNDTKISFSGSADKINTISSMNVGLVQNVLNSSTQKITNLTLKSTDAGTQWNFSGNMSFSQSRADCFSSTTFTQSEARQLTESGYVTSTNLGVIQAGKNYFRFYPVQDTTDAKYNLLRSGFYIERVAEFVVPDALCPTVDLTSKDKTEGGGSSDKSYVTTVNCSLTEKEYFSVTCTNCSGSGKIKTGTTSVTCPTCNDFHNGEVPRRAGWWTTCSRCNGTGICQTCGGKGYTTGGLTGSTKYGCSGCGGSGGGIHIGATPYHEGSGSCSSCEGGQKWVVCGNCSGNGTVSEPVYSKCDTCKGTGSLRDSKDVICSDCNGTGKYRVRKWYTHYYAKYVYVDYVKASFTNSNGCTANASWTYQWAPGHSGSCTKTAFTRTGSSASISELENGITFTNTNKVSFTAIIYCKQYFENYFTRSSDMETVSPDYSSKHSEAYDSSDWKTEYIGPGDGSSSGGGSSGGGSSGGSTSEQVCSKCNGSGEVEVTCSTCDGFGYEREYGSQKCGGCLGVGKKGYGNQLYTCTQCFGTGKKLIYSGTCRKCGGQKVQKGTCSTCGGSGHV